MYSTPDPFPRPRPNSELALRQEAAALQTYPLDSDVERGDIVANADGSLRVHLRSKDGSALTYVDVRRGAPQNEIEATLRAGQDAIHKKFAAKMPADEAGELTLRAKISYFLSKNDFPDFEKAIVAYMKTYSSKMTDADLNSLAWSVFQN